jgi:hypothetical protein
MAEAGESGEAAAGGAWRRASHQRYQRINENN